ncbi:MAG: GHMP kinase [Defluviitaleaceae bacterium]|nr:GHMP kinase [Defluviitaleaceae bacterium]MCL2274424.1 GHMP kinase [Defluviitaleaceae bacterium]
MQCTDKFISTYNYPPTGIAFCPYRVCPIGAHSDHQHGKVTGFALDMGIHIAYGAKKNGVVELVSLQFPKRAQFHVTGVPKVKQNDWADYLRGAMVALGKRYSLQVGLCGVIEGSLPIGGLSSSAAVIIAYLSALCKVNGITLASQEIISIALEAENEYVGVSCGKLDQSCEVLSKKGHLLYLDTMDDSYELIPQPGNMKPFEIAVFFSGIERTLAGSKFNMRVDECKSAAYALMAFEGMEYGKFDEARLRCVPRAVFDKHRDKLPEPWRKRADHWYTEFARVQAGARAWRNGDIEALGKLSFESGESSIVNYETGSEELTKLYSIMRGTDGIYGGRFSGAGFRGCCMALVDPAFKEEVERNVTEAYAKEFPALADKFSVHFCQSGDGVGASA